VGAAGERLPGGEFRALWTAEAASVLGDQLAKVALAVLIYERTGSAAWSGLAYALTMFTPMVTGPTLSKLGDRVRRRELMALCCLLQAGCVAVMALPEVPLGVLVGAVVGVSGLASPFRAARSAIVLDILGKEHNKAGRARLMMIRESGQLIGLAGAAGVIAVTGVTVALIADVVSFLIAAALIRFGLRARLAPRSLLPGSGSNPSAWQVLRDPSVRPLVGLILAIGVTAVPDAVVVPLVDQSGAPDWAVGLLLAADCLGIVLGAYLVGRLAPDRQRALIGPLAVLSMAPLVLFAVRPGLVPMIALLVVSGAGAAYLPLAFGEYTERVPAAITSSANGLLDAGFKASQGAAAITGGVLAQQFRSASMAVALIGVLGVLLAGCFALTWIRALRTPQVIVE